MGAIMLTRCLFSLIHWAKWGYPGIVSEDLALEAGASLNFVARPSKVPTATEAIAWLSEL